MLLTNARIDLFTLKTANGKRGKWRETQDHVVFFPFAFAVNVMLNLSKGERLTLEVTPDVLCNSSP